MSKLHDTTHAERPKQTAGRLRSRPIADARSRRTQTKQMRQDVALDMIGHFLRTYFRTDSYTEKERIIQW